MKKKTTKALLLSLCAILLVTASVLGTVAYLTSTAEVKNTFTVGNVAITLDETDVDNSSESARDQANSYKLMPGHTYTKDPIVHVAITSEDCYLFVKVVNEISDIEADTTVAAQMAAKGWKAVDGQTNVYVYVGTEAGATNPAIVKANTNVTVFETFKIKDDIDNTTLATYNGKTITVTAYAIQADGFAEKSASEIWAAGGFGTTTPTT